MGEGAHQVTDYRSTEPTWDTDGPREDPSPDPSADVEVLAQDIEQTRDEMTGTVEAIGDRLDPANLINDAKQTVRDATVGKVEQMANNVAETASEFVGDARYTAQDAGTGLLETVKRNPIPAAMAGIGIGWLLMNRGSGRGDRRSTYEQARWTGRDEWDRYDRRSQPGIADRAGGAVEQVGQQAGQLAGTVGSKVGGVADQARSTVGQVPDQVGVVARDVQWNAQRIVEDNPLAVGAIALAVGAAIGMALPETQTEQRVLGPAAEKAISTAEEAAGEAVNQLETANR
jgi:ElaB/YqjD/DUF883 family membrane-anchored ribosome-binding protein